ncbi:MAG: AMP-binding protein [Syntrophales bacterium]|nr:AMP-binding protein [Syntrophales bacterium]MDY0043999.1 AMP-binding protein [Syntrophales bacterium]
MNEANLASLLNNSSTTFSNNIAIIYKDRLIPYQELNRQVNSFACTLRRLGIKKGDKVAIMLPNIPEFVIAYFGAMKLGAVAVTLNTASTSYELAYLLDNSDARVFITIPSSAKRFQDIREDLPFCGHLITTEGTEGDLSMETMISEEPLESDLPKISGDDPAVIVYTAGLTGKPLGAVLTHNNLYTQSFLVKEICAGNDQDKGLCLIPLFHTFGATANMLCALNMGAAMVMIDKFNLENVFKTIENTRLTYIAAVPRVYLGMLLYEDAAKADLTSLRLCITGGSTMPVDYIHLFEEKFKTKLLEGYGLTEASPVCSFSRLERTHKPGSIGIPVTGVEAKVVDDKNRDLDSGNVGELVIRGPNVMKGYYRADEKTVEVIIDGWLHTGDLALIDEDGDIFLKGRKKRMIITSGFNVYPKEVEQVVAMHEDVKECVVVAKEDLLRGEVVKAVIVLEKDATADDKEIMRHCRQYLSSYKVPREVEFTDRLP